MRIFLDILGVSVCLFFYSSASVYNSLLHVLAQRWGKLKVRNKKNRFLCSPGLCCSNETLPAGHHTSFHTLTQLSDRSGKPGSPWFTRTDDILRAVWQEYCRKLFSHWGHCYTATASAAAHLLLFDATSHQRCKGTWCDVRLPARQMSDY